MDFEFYLPHGYEKQDILALNKVVVRKKPILRIFVPILRIALSAFGLFLLIAGLMFLFGDYDEKSTGVFCVLVGAIWFFLGVFYFRYLAWRSRRVAIKNTGALTVTLTEDGIGETNTMTSAVFPYSTIQEIVCYCDTYFLFVDKRHAFILPIRHFSAGTVASFEAFIGEKCGKSIRKL